MINTYLSCENKGIPQSVSLGGTLEPSDWAQSTVTLNQTENRFFHLI